MQLKAPRDATMADARAHAQPGHRAWWRWARACRSSTPATSCCAPSRWTATATTPATGSTGSTGPTRPTTGAWACRRPATTRTTGRSCSRCWPTRRSSRRRRTSRALDALPGDAPHPQELAAVPAAHRRRDPAARALREHRPQPDPRPHRDDPRGGPVRPPGRVRAAVVLFNGADEAAALHGRSSLQGRAPRAAPGAEGLRGPVVRGAAFDAGTGSFTVPGRTTAVFVAGTSSPSSRCPSRTRGSIRAGARRVVARRSARLALLGLGGLLRSRRRKP